MAAQMPVGPGRVRLPDPSSLEAENPAAVKQYLNTLNTALAMALSQRPASTSPSGQLLLLSPNGSSFRVTINDAGALTAEKLHDNAPPPPPPP